MTSAPANLTDLSNSLAEASARGAKIASVDLRALNRVLTHVPEDMTATVEAGITLASLQATLAPRGQWLPLDPPGADRLSICDLLSANASGPRRFGYGTARDHLLGLKVALADGRIVASGGKVVKNVAGYDLHKLFLGARGSLGIIVEATFKLRPLPEAEQFVSVRCASLDAATALIEAILDSPLTPVVLDLHNHSGLALVVGFAGSQDEVAWQLTEAARLGVAEPANLAYEAAFWQPGKPPTTRLSVLPSRLGPALAGLGDAPFVARAGNGVVHHRGAAASAPLPNPVLTQRVKNAFDPNHIFPEPA